MNFEHVYLSLLLSATFIGKFILNINTEHAQDCSCPVATFTFCSSREKLPRQGGLPASRSCPGATKNSCEQSQASDRALSQWVVPGSCNITNIKAYYYRIKWCLPECVAFRLYNFCRRIDLSDFKNLSFDEEVIYEYWKFVPTIITRFRSP